MDSQLGELIAKGYKLLEETRAQAQREQEEAEAQRQAEMDAAWATLEGHVKEILPGCVHPYIDYGRERNYWPGQWPSVKIVVPELAPILLKLNAKHLPHGDTPYCLPTNYYLNQPLEWDYDDEDGPYYVVANWEYSFKAETLEKALGKAHELAVQRECLEVEAREKNHKAAEDHKQWLEQQAAKEHIKETRVVVKAEPQYPEPSIIPNSGYTLHNFYELLERIATALEAKV